MMFHFVLGFILFAEVKYVQGGGKVTSKVSPNHVDKGETATVTCYFPDDISQMTAVWVIVEHHPDNEHVGETGGDKVTCKASPKQVKIEGTATVTCQFPYDVSQMTTVWIVVDHYPAEPERRQVNLVDCTKVNSQELKCDVWKEGYVIEGKVTTSLKLRITNISAQHSGHYYCHMVPPEGERPKAKKCRLVVFNVIPVPTTTERTVETSAGVESNGSDMDKETNSAVNSDVRHWLTVVTVVIVVMLAVQVVIVIVTRCRQ